MSSVSEISSPLSRQKKKRKGCNPRTWAGRFIIVVFLVYVVAALAIFVSGQGKSNSENVVINGHDTNHRDEATLGETHEDGDRQIRHVDEDNFLPRVLALVFPQFHRDPLNDHLWGEGFTDWDNLRKAPAQNRLGFNIPRPTELGYYDYTHTAPRKKQGELAREYDIDGFVYHHYWFYDPDRPGPSLHAPLVEMLKDGHPDVPFALHWCAMKWTNTWSGNVGPEFVFKEAGVLQKQYFPEKGDDPLIVEHYNWLKHFFHHPNYIKVDGKPLFMMYQRKPGSMVVLRKFRELAVQDGFPGLYFTVGLNKAHEHLLNVEDESLTQQFERLVTRTLSFNLYDKVVSYPNPNDWSKGRSLEVPQWCKQGQSKVERLTDIVGILSSFDNTPRRNFEEANLFASDDKPDGIVERFRKNLRAALVYESCCFPDSSDRLRRDRKDDDRFVLINAMNEWAEGMMLEPSDVYGRKFLEAIRDTKTSVREEKCLSL